MNAKCIEESEIWGENYAHSTGYRDQTKGELFFGLMIKASKTEITVAKRETRKSISTLELDLVDIPTQPFKSRVL